MLDGESSYALNGAQDITIETIGSTVYALVASSIGDSVQIIDVSDPSAPVAVSSVFHGEDDFNALDKPNAITTVTIGSSVYALVASFLSDGVQIIEFSTSLSGGALANDDSTGASSNEHKTRPTFGLSHETFTQFVTGGFTFNENTFDVTHNFWTPFEIQTIKIGEVNTISSTVYAPKELHVQEFLFGIPVVGEAHKAELGIEIFYTNDGVISSVNVVQETEIIDADSLVVTYTETACSSDDTEKVCDTTVLNMVFLEPLRDNVMALKAIDYKGRTQITYLNEGFDISGESLNPMVTKMIPGPEKYEGSIKVTQTAKYSNLWLADDNRAFTSNDAESFVLVFQPNKRLSDDPNTNAMTRMHSHFDVLKGMENYKASLVMKSLCTRCGDESFDKINDIFAYDYPEEVTRANDSELQKLIDAENIRIQKLVEEMFKSQYPTKTFE